MERTLELLVVQNPFDRRKRALSSVSYEGQSLYDLRTQYVPADIEVAISINGTIIEKEHWPYVHPRPGDQIAIVPLISGGGDGGKNVLGAITMIALIWATPGLSAMAIGEAWKVGMAAGFAGLGLWHAVAGVGILLAGGMLINSVMPKPSLKSGAFDSVEESQTYGWNPASVQKQGIVIPRFYGKNKLYGNVISVNTEVDTEDNTKQILNMLLCLCQGPVHNISSIEINDQPIGNYEDVEVDTKLGTLNQTVISFSGGNMICKPDYRPNRTVSYTGGSEEYTTPDNDFDDLEIDLVFPRGLYYANDQGGLSTHTVGLKIEIKEVGGSYSTLVDSTESNKTTSALWKTYRASQTYSGGSPVTITHGKQYVVKVTKTTEDKGTRYGDELRIGGVREIINTEFTYPGRALLGISAVATEQLSGSIKVSCIVEGRLVRVYNGSSWSIEYSTNPAWVLYDILTQPVISGDGDGNPWTVERYDGIDPDRLDLAKFYELAEWCDEMVDDGEGGTEKRITFNGGFDVGTTMWEAALKVCEIARCCLIWNGIELTLAIDKPVDTPVQMFTIGNILKNTFKETFLPQEDRASEIEVHYRDQLQDYQRTTFTVFDTNAGTATKKVSLELFGITKQSEAWRAGKYRLAQNRYLKSTIEFEADIDAIACTLGDVIYVQHDVPNWSEGGRVLHADFHTVTVDKELTELSGADEIMVRCTDGQGNESIETHLVSGIDGNKVTIQDTWTITPQAGDVYAYGQQNLSARKYRIIGLRKRSDQTVNITAIEYNESVYDMDSDTPEIPIQGYSPPQSVGQDEIKMPPRWNAIKEVYPKDVVIGPPTLDVPLVTGIEFYSNGNKVTWTEGIVTYAGTAYTVSAETTGDTNRYIYWDVNANPNILHTTNTLADAYGNGKFILCVNQAGKPYPVRRGEPYWGEMLVVETLGAITAQLGDVLAGTITGTTITGSTLRTATSGRRVVVDANGIKFVSSDVTTGKYSNFKYGDGTKYGTGYLAKFANTDTGGLPMEIQQEQTVADIRLFNRSSTPSGKASVGDLAVVNGILYVCTGAGTPGTWTKVGTQT